MNSIPPPPPPPPSLPSPHPAAPVNDNLDKSPIIVSPSEDDQDVLNALHRWTNFLPSASRGASIIALWRKTPTLLQQGPQCGLVALVMGAHSLGISMELDKVHQKAVSTGITRQGEMFSASKLCELAVSFGLKASVVDRGLEALPPVLHWLSAGKLLLVPYDADANHSPCMKTGHKAHWALITGCSVLTPHPVDHLNGLERSSDGVYRIQSTEEEDGKILCSLVHSKSSVYLLAKHGKSKRTAIWSYSSLEESNGNLVQVDPKRTNPLEYVLPPDNRLTDLCHKVILLG